jgi:hypothetical protein
MAFSFLIYAMVSAAPWTVDFSFLLIIAVASAIGARAVAPLPGVTEASPKQPDGDERVAADDWRPPVRSGHRATASWLTAAISCVRLLLRATRVAALRFLRPMEGFVLCWVILILLTCGWDWPAFVELPVVAPVPPAVPRRIYVPPRPVPPDPNLALYGVSVEAAASAYSAEWDRYNRSLFEAELEAEAPQMAAAFRKALIAQLEPEVARHNADVRSAVLLRWLVKYGAWIALAAWTIRLIKRAKEASTLPDPGHKATPCEPLNPIVTPQQ